MRPRQTRAECDRLVGLAKLPGLGVTVDFSRIGNRHVRRALARCPRIRALSPHGWDEHSDHTDVPYEEHHEYSESPHHTDNTTHTEYDDHREWGDWTD